MSKDKFQKEEIRYKLKAVGISLVFALLGFGLMQVILSNSFSCNLDPQTYTNSTFAKNGVSIEKATDLCNNYKMSFNFASFAIFVIPIIIAFILFVLMPRWDKERDLAFKLQNGKCGRCGSSVGWMDCWYDADNSKKVVCERCAKIMGLDKEVDK